MKYIYITGETPSGSVVFTESENANIYYIDTVYVIHRPSQKTNAICKKRALDVVDVDYTDIVNI